MKVIRRADILASALALCATIARPPAHAQQTEPEAAQRLFDLCRDRRPSSWSATERLDVDELIDSLVSSHTPYAKELARGKWRLAYTQRGLGEPDPVGLLPFNQQFQIFSTSEVVSVAEILGPALEVRAAGSWREDNSDNATPKRFRADLTQGALCGSITIGRVAKANIGRTCVPLPLSPRSDTYRVVNVPLTGSNPRI